MKYLEGFCFDGTPPDTSSAGRSRILSYPKMLWSPYSIWPPWHLHFQVLCSLTISDPELPGFLSRSIHVSSHASLNLFLNPLLVLHSPVEEFNPYVHHKLLYTCQWFSFLGLPDSPKSQIRVWDCQHLSQVTILVGLNSKCLKLWLLFSPQIFPECNFYPEATLET